MRPRPCNGLRSVLRLLRLCSTWRSGLALAAGFQLFSFPLMHYWFCEAEHTPPKVHWAREGCTFQTWCCMWKLSCLRSILCNFLHIWICFRICQLINALSYQYISWNCFKENVTSLNSWKENLQQFHRALFPPKFSVTIFLVTSVIFPNHLKSY
jgi:hypothetical protein